MGDRFDHSYFFPLTIGNRWHYNRVFELRLLTGSFPPGLPIVRVTGTVRRELVGTGERYGRVYVVEEELRTESGRTEVFERSSFYRQDRSGLFEADPPDAGSPVGQARDEAPSAGNEFTAARVPAATWEQVAASLPESADHEAFRHAFTRLLERRATILQALHERTAPRAGVASAREEGGPLPGEITRLRYPLHPGQAWTIREEPLLTFTAVVDGVDQLDLPAGRFVGLRVAITPPGGLQAGEFVHQWFGRQGLLRFELRLFGIATDATGQEIGTFESRDLEELDAISITRPARESVDLPE